MSRKRSGRSGYDDRASEYRRGRRWRRGFSFADFLTGVVMVMLAAGALWLIGGRLAGEDEASDDGGETAESGGVTATASSDVTEATDSEEETEDLSDIDEVLTTLGLTMMFDGSIVDPDWILSELDSAGVTGMDSSSETEELYRYYQLYGQGEGMSAYDASSVEEETSERLEAYEETVRNELEEENGVGWLTVTADIYDTQEITVWNTEYELSEEAARALEQALALFEDEGYDAGFVLLDLTTGAALSFRAGLEVYSASVIKAPYIFSLLESGVEPTEDMYLAGNQSDNDAYLRVRDTWGDDLFAEWLTDTGIPEEQSQSNYVTTTPLDLCRMFYRGRDLVLGDETWSDWVRETFTDSLNSAAALTIGTSKSVYSKAGWISETDGYSVSSYTNAAIVDGEYPYIVAFMSNSLGYVGLEYAQVLMPVLDEIHDEMNGVETDFGGIDYSVDDFSQGYTGEDGRSSDGAPDPGAQGAPAEAETETETGPDPSGTDSSEAPEGAGTAEDSPGMENASPSGTSGTDSAGPADSPQADTTGPGESMQAGPAGP